MPTIYRAHYGFGYVDAVEAKDVLGRGYWVWLADGTRLPRIGVDQEYFKTRDEAFVAVAETLDHEQTKLQRQLFVVAEAKRRLERAYGGPVPRLRAAAAQQQPHEGTACQA